MKKKSTLDISIPAEAAQAAALHYVTDDRPGIVRLGSGDSFSYRAADGTSIKDKSTLDRISAIAIPPAWTEVWISSKPNGHIQATGRDARGRKQYRYHERWNQIRNESKFDRMIPFGRALPRLRAALEVDLALPGLPLSKALATVVSLLEMTFIRIGNREYARDNDSFGLTTMLARHVKVAGSEIRFRFRGKSGKEHTIRVADRRIARLVKQCQELPGQTLFQYLDENNEVRPIDASDVNDYLRGIAGDGFTAKDFRTWGGTLLAAQHLLPQPEGPQPESFPPPIRSVIAAVAGALGNTVAVCRKCYIHPNILAVFGDERLLREWTANWKKARASEGLTREESALIHFLEDGA